MVKQKEGNHSGTPTVVLTVLDGWGICEDKEGNAIKLGKTPNYDRYVKTMPFTKLSASGRDVGLENDQDGNSEAGHLNIGAGRVVLQDTVKISRAIDNGSFFKNPAFERAVKHVKRHNSTLHLMGLLSNSMSAHANPDHLLALLTYVQKVKLPKIVLHLFTDGRDSSRYEAIELIKRLKLILGNVQIGSIAGRYFAMDRGQNWDRIKRVYDMLTLGKGLQAESPEDAILEAYNRNETDEFIQPTLICPEGSKPKVISFQDSVIFFNLRSDRARQLTKAFVEDEFDGFKRQKILDDIVFVGMTDFGPDLDQLTAFPSEDVPNTLPIVLKAYRQLYIAESEKYAHATYFFNGGYDHTVAGEDRVVIPSPHVPTYDLTPEMSTPEIIDYVVQDLEKHAHDFIMMNIAAPDMVAHTGNLRSSIRAVEGVDRELGVLEKAVVKAGAILIVTADHGNIEELINLKKKTVDTEHSTNPVPFIIIGSGLAKNALRAGGRLADIAPTILSFFNVDPPKEMTGKSLIK